MAYKCKNFWFYSPKYMFLGTILHEILLQESMEAWKFKFSYFPRKARYLYSVKSVETPAFGTFIWMSHAIMTPDPTYCLNPRKEDLAFFDFQFCYSYVNDMSHPHRSRKWIGGCYVFLLWERGPYPYHTLKLSGMLVWAKQNLVKLLVRHMLIACVSIS